LDGLLSNISQASWNEGKGKREAVVLFLTVWRLGGRSRDVMRSDSPAKRRDAGALPVLRDPIITAAHRNRVALARRVTSWPAGIVLEVGRCQSLAGRTFARGLVAECYLRSATFHSSYGIELARSLSKFLCRAWTLSLSIEN
jgi:hypothetical protein